MKPAIVVIDMQNDFFEDEPLKGIKASLVAKINCLTAFARDKKIPVIWVRQEYKADMSDINLNDKKTGRRITVEGTPGAEILDELDRSEDETVIVKKRYSAFFGTSFDKVIDGLGVDTLVLCGVNTHACVRTTLIDAFQRDIEVIVAKDCVGSWNPAHHDISLEYFEKNMSVRVLSNSEIEKVFG
ncbi:MAG: cysteine hydrolase [Candidatus Aenigmarchaeota archaeon]|nr:cysteine hydrolase [Candidatus Aenigmarchaeota archaeon]